MPLRDTQDRGDALLRISEAAKLCHVSADTLRRWSDQGRVAVIVLPSGQRRYRRSDVLAIIAPQDGAA
jgi:predicted site-specific integrase-resolvase